MNPIDPDEVALILSGVKIFQDLDVEVVRAAAARMLEVTFTDQQPLVQRGQPGDYLYVLIRGVAEVILPAEQPQRERRIRLKKGDVVGEISMLTGGRYGADVMAIGDLAALRLARADFLKLAELHHSFAESLSGLMRDRLSQNGDINQVGKYRLTGKLGEGNMALVFSAYDPELDREVAVKMLKYELALDSEFLQRFELEARIIASLSHPHIVNVHEVINEYSTRFIVMEKLDGENLGEVLRQRGAFGIDQTREILQQVAGALQYAHQHGAQGIVHRDIKPSNIMIDRFGNTKLTDFGIAGPPKKQSDAVEGSPSYLAPEVIKGNMVDGRADIYALGVMAFHMLTNSLPFSASTLDKILDMQLSQAPPDIRNHCPGIDDSLAEFIQRALEKDIDQRIADWDEILHLLRHVERMDRIPLEANEMGVIIRLRDVTYSDAARIINAMQRMLQDSDVDHSIEMQRGDVDQ